MFTRAAVRRQREQILRERFDLSNRAKLLGQEFITAELAAKLAECFERFDVAELLLDEQAALIAENERLQRESDRLHG